MARDNYRGLQTPNDSDLKTIIGGDAVQSAQLTDQWGRKIGEALAKSVASAQMRTIFAKVRQIEMNWSPIDDANSDQARQAQRDLILLKPKLRYQAERKNELRDLADLLTQTIDLVQNRENFQRFVDFFEAIVAYHKAKEDER